MKLKVKDVIPVWNVLSDIIDINDNPFRGQARRLLFELQTEVKFLSEMDKKELESIKDKEIEVDQLSAPAYFPDEYSDILKLVCESVPEKTSQIKALLK